jgi:tRNA uridine 5-carboxymethylaminomethyl modification enzyme
MFTSRAEYRLRLRADNADERLTPRGIAVGCVGKERAAAFAAKDAALTAARELIAKLCATPAELARHGLTIAQDGLARSAAALLAYPDASLDRLAAIWPELGALRPDVAAQIEIDARYAAYLARQEADIAAFRRDEALTLPPQLNYGAIGGLSAEVREKLAVSRPETLGAAARIPGVTPAALTALLRHVRRREGPLADPAPAREPERKLA